MTTNDGSPTDSTVSGILVETVEEESDDDRTIQDELMSEASSVGSVSLIGAEDLRPGDMVDLTSPTKCRIFMTQTEGGQRIYCCCGNDRDTCNRRNHRNKSDPHRAPPRWYHAFPATRGSPRPVDGRMDQLRSGLTQEEMDSWRAAEREEIARVAAAFYDPDDESESLGLGGSVASAEGDDGLPSIGASTPLRRFVNGVTDSLDEAVEGIRRVTFGDTQYAETPVAGNRSAELNTEAPPPVPIRRDDGGASTSGSPQEAPPFPSTGRPRHPVASTSAAGGSAADGSSEAWFGLREANTETRRICNTREDLAYWLGLHARLCRTFDTRTAAEAWLRDGDAEDRTLWIGLERSDGARRITSDFNVFANLVASGAYQHRETFPTQALGNAWVSRERAVLLPDPEVEITEVRRSNTAPRPSAARAPRGGAPAPEAPDASLRMWYGLVEPTEARLICSTVEERDVLVRSGATWCATFYQLEEAEKWLQSAPPLKPTIRRGSIPGLLAPSVSAATDRNASTTPSSDRPVTDSASGERRNGGYRDIGHRDINEEKESYAENQGKDPSVGDDTRIYGVDRSDLEAVEKTLCPEGLDPAECVQFIERSLDVTALPGMYNADNSDRMSTGEELAVALLQQVDTTQKAKLGHDGLWQSKRAHSLGSIKSAEDLKKLSKNVRKAWKKAWKSTKRRWASFLYERRYPRVFVVEYLRYGLLPRIIENTYDNYLGLLSCACELLYNEETSVKWKGSRAEALINFHGEQLRQERSYAADYGDHILGTYVYLRDAASKTDYNDPALLDPLWDRVHALQQKSEESGGSSTATGGNKSTRCSWCHRTGLHSEGRTNCPAKDLSAAQARKLLKDVPKSTGLTKVKQACVEFANQKAADPDGDIDAIITTVRSSHLGLT